MRWRCHNTLGGWPSVKPDRFVARTCYSGDLSQALQKRKQLSTIQVVMIYLAPDSLLSRAPAVSSLRSLGPVCHSLTPHHSLWSPTSLALNPPRGPQLGLNVGFEVTASEVGLRSRPRTSSSGGVEVGRRDHPSNCVESRFSQFLVSDGLGGQIWDPPIPLNRGRRVTLDFSKG